MRRHAFTNGLAERLEQMLLHDHWRIEFRRRYFTRLAQLATEPRAAHPPNSSGAHAMTKTELF